MFYKLLSIICWGLLILCPSVKSWSASPSDISLSSCTDKKLGITFLCGADWELETDQDAILAVISEDPAVTLTVARTKSPVKFVEQLSWPVLRELGQYASSGFTTKPLKLAGDEALEVNGIPEDFPEMKLRDFYILHGDYLYSVLFSVNPRQALKDYQPLFNKIIGSIQFQQSESSGEPTEVPSAGQLTDQ